MFAFSKPTPFVRSVLIVVFSGFVLQLILGNWVDVPVYSSFALGVREIGLEKLWQLWTYPLVLSVGSNAVIEILFSMLFLWWALVPFEMRFGSRKTIQFCLVLAVISGLVALGVGFSLSTSRFYYSGFGPIILGLISAVAWSFRGYGKLSLFGVFPLKAEHLILILVGFNVLGLLSNKDFVGFAAEMTAIGLGIFFVQRPKSVRFGKKTSKNRIFSVIEGQKKKTPTWLN